MIIDGKAIAEDILRNLTLQANALKQRGVTPTLAVIMIGDNPASLAYIKQKQKAAEKIGARVIVSNTITSLHTFNNDPTIHGIIVQRPVPTGVGEYHVTPRKDVDGFEPNSPFDVPVALAAIELLRNIKYQISNIKYEEKDKHENAFWDWLRQKHIVVVGRGETAGAPIARFLENRECATSIIHSKTPNPKELMRQADCIVSCVGKERVVTASVVKPGAILISVGLWRDAAGKLRGDYDEAEIEKIASFYTPTPGGVGPVNVACLMQNLMKSTSL